MTSKSTVDVEIKMYSQNVFVFLILRLNQLIICSKNLSKYVESLENLALKDSSFHTKNSIRQVFRSNSESDNILNARISNILSLL